MAEKKLRKIRDRKKGFFVVDNIIIDKIARHCTPYCISVYLSLCRHADIDKQTCFPSEELIAEENNVGETTVKNSIKKLEKLGLISVFRSRRTNGTRNVNIYTLLYILKWEHQPETTDTVDIINEPPESNNSESQSREVSNKETHSIKETNNKEDIFKKEKCNNTDFKKFFENYKPDWIK